MEALKASLAAGQADKEKPARTRGRRVSTLRKAG
jgi:hypothetical protein